jgi:hypothetical protein
MWQKLYDPPFVLPPKHAVLFCVAAAVLSDTVGWTKLDEDWEGDGYFDRLTQGQKQQAILIVAKSLLDATVEPPDVTAAIAATVDAIYNELIVLVESEMGDSTATRQMILDALSEVDFWEELNEGLDPGAEPEVPVSADSEDHETWNYLIDHLRETVLDDYDFDMEHKFLDLPPDQCQLLKSQMNIAPNYFVDVIDDPSVHRLEEIQREFLLLVN